MPGIERPLFREGQILSAADLNRIGDHAAAQRGRHDRYQHTWGIASGLALEKTPRKAANGADYVEVTLQPGVAIDGHGFEIIVQESFALDPARFTAAAVADPTLDAAREKTTWYPVFLVGIETQSAREPSSGSGCGSGGGAARVLESFDVEFGAPGDQSGLDEQTPGPESLAVGPGTGGPRLGFRVLVGYVAWSASLPNFIDVSNDPQEGVGRRYTGARAASVVSPGDVLELESSESAAEPAVLVLGGQDAAVIGKRDASGAVQPLLRIDRRGNLAPSGQIVGAALGGLLVSSGIASDGMVLPLPSGVGSAEGLAIHVHVTPRFSLDAAPSEVLDGRVPIVEVCRVDADLRVHCRVRWTMLGDPTDILHRPGAVDFTLLAAAEQGGAP